jgi:hypothetical protein
MSTEQTKESPVETAPLSIRQISKIEDWLMSEASARATAEQRVAFRQAMTKEFRALNAEAGSRSAVSYYQALAHTHIVDLAVLEPYLAQLRAAEAAALARTNYLEAQTSAVPGTQSAAQIDWAGIVAWAKSVVDTRSIGFPPPLPSKDVIEGLSKLVAFQ